MRNGGGKHACAMMVESAPAHSKGQGKGKGSRGGKALRAKLSHQTLQRPSWFRNTIKMKYNEARNMFLDVAPNVLVLYFQSILLVYIYKP